MGTKTAATTDWPILLILVGDDCARAISAAIDHAKLTSGKLRVIQILTSSLYHYGHQDLVATRPSKREFLLYIRDEVLRRGRAEIQALEQTARDTGVALEVYTVESEDIHSAAISEAQKEYDVVFLPRQKKKLLPLFKKTLAGYLQKKISGKIIEC